MLENVPISGLDALQTTDLDRSMLKLSLKVPVAVNCSGTPIGAVGALGLTSIEVRMVETRSLPVDEIPLAVAVMVACPALIAVT